MRKNIVFIHLESVSQMAFWQYSAEMVTLFSLMQNSTSFSRFYAASTSSVMCMADLIFGDSSVFDHSEVFPKDNTSLREGSGNLFRILAQNGYVTHGMQYGSFCRGDAPNNFWGVWPESCGPFTSHRNRETMYRETRDFLEKSRAARQPFAFYYWNMNTHLQDEDPLKDSELAYHSRFQAGYRLLDMSVKRLLADLSDLGLLENTLIVVFGDHGDDLWRHGIYRGRSHIIDPYANVCWCPLFIYDNGQERMAISPQMISMIDLKATLCQVLLPDKEPEAPATPFAGINILANSRGIAFTQSMFALQRERSDPSKSITKSYGVTDGEFRLMASCPADFDDSGGLEMYLEQWDYGSTRNLLEFCRLDETGNIAGYALENAVHPHFFMTFTDKTIRNMSKSYDTLRQYLLTFVKQKEQEALKHFRGAKPHVFPDEMFTHVRTRKR